MTKSKVSLGKCHIALENMWVILSFDVYFLHNSTVIRGLFMISISSDHKIFAPCFMSLDMLHCLLVYGLWEVEQNLDHAVV